MSKSKKPAATPSQDGGSDNPAAAAQYQELIRKAEANNGMTGRFVVMMRHGATTRATRALEDQAGVATVSTAESEGTPLTASDVGDKGLVLSKLGMAVVTLDQDQRAAVASLDEDTGVQEMFPERVVYAAGSASFMRGQLVTAGAEDELRLARRRAVAMPVPGRGFAVTDYQRDAILRLLEALFGWGAASTFAPAILGSAGAAGVARVLEQLEDDDEFTWGLRATEVDRTPFTGSGVSVAVLDTGIDLTHPDFLGRVAGKRSFIPGEDVQDRHGHGTHCAGVVCGPEQPTQGPRYGVAPDAQLFVGKVLSNVSGSAVDASVLEGIDWAITQGCRVVSMSLEGPPDARAAALYERVGERAREAGTALIAAAGNGSRRRQGFTSPVGAPANASMIMAVAALDASLNVADFSNTSGPGLAAQVDIAGPGVNIHSTFSQTALNGAGLYRSLSGTSMATPHVAGIAALIAEAKPRFTAGDILNGLTSIAKPIPGEAADIGAGLVRAPRRSSDG